MQNLNSIVIVTWASVTYALGALFAFLLKSQRISRISRKLNCEEPPMQKSRYPLGIDNVLRALNADKKKFYPDDLIQRSIENGSNTYSVSILGTKIYATSDEENIKAMLALQFKDFDLGPHRRGNFWPLLGNGIFTADGAGWEHSRTMMKPQFARDQISDLELEERHVQNMMQNLDTKLPADRKGWSEDVDLQVLFFRLTLDTATEFLFGKSANSQLSLMPGREKNKKLKSNDLDSLEIDFAGAFDTAQMALASRARLADRYWLLSPKGFKESCKACHNFIDHFVRLALSPERREKYTEEERTGTGKYVFLDALAKETQDPIELRSQLLNVLLAGRDTTASLLGWLFMLLTKDPARYKKLRDLIVAEFGTYENPSNITFSKIKSCQYLQFCINEALRLYPVVPANMRVANKDTTLPRGGGKDGKSKIFIPKGTTVEYYVHVLHHRKDLWGEDAEEFIPERWQDRKFGWDFLPFNGGPRICIGQQFALTEASYVTIRLLQRFDTMSPVNAGLKVRHNLTLTNCNADGVEVRVHAVC
ncbi:Cytochrome P450 monooxygenase [Podosphaera aphanis]|nr:Cytochrome P450 monooxygenase [Podosphaera aphanis]